VVEAGGVSALAEALERLPGVHVLTIGDLMLDEYVWGRVSRISPEAPVPVVEVEGRSHVPGGAANVASGVGALGGTASPGGVVGDDEHDAVKVTHITRTIVYPKNPDAEGLRGAD